MPSPRSGRLGISKIPDGPSGLGMTLHLEILWTLRYQNIEFLHQ